MINILKQTSQFNWEENYKGNNLSWLKERTIFITVHGSHAYNTNIEGSDIDYRGIAIPPKEYFLGINDHFEQVQQNDPDLTIFDIRKFFKLSLDNNPNTLEILFVDPTMYQLTTPFFWKIYENRNLFLSKNAKHRLSGYAFSQLGRIQLHRGYLLNPPTHKPTRKEFDLPDEYPIPKDQLDAAQAAITKRMDEWNWKDLENVEPAIRQVLKDLFRERILEITKWSQDLYEEKLWKCITNSLGFDSNFIKFLDKERLYKNKKKEWDHYQEWKKNRNPKRAEMEKIHGFDCYSDDTEFLTKDGWKHFDNISEKDELATVYLNKNANGKDITNRHFLGIEYQKSIDKFDSIYNGPMYSITGIHTDTFITANHKMLIRKVERKSQKEYEWELIEAAHLPDTFDVVIYPTPNNKNFSNKKYFTGIPIPPHAYLRLIGWYLSDGTSLFKEDGCTVKAIRISQIEGGKLSANMTKWYKKYGYIAKAGMYKYKRKPNIYNSKFHVETSLNITNNIIINNIVNDCSRTKNKRIPRWVFELSKVLMETVLFDLIKGDGTKRTHKTKEESYIYYSSLKELADDVQELAMHCGWETTLWGPFDYFNKNDGLICPMYQVHLRKNILQNRRFVRNQNVSKKNVENQRIVCFTVPNGTLITRRNGKISIHGNCKHGMHLKRLADTCIDLLKTGEYIVKRPNAEELISIRNGAWSYEKLLEWFKDAMLEIEELYQTTQLQNTPNRKKLNQLLMEIVEESF